jgi:PAS domain-containing protein
MGRGKVVAWDEKGKPIRMVGSHVDINEKKEMEEALMLLQSRQKAILDNLPYLAWLKNRDGRFEMVNKLFALAAHKTPQEIIGFTDKD